MACMLDMGGMEADIARQTVPARPYIFPLTPGQDYRKFAEVLQKANPECIVSQAGPNSLSVILPPNIKVGNEPVNLKRIAFTLTAHQAVKDLDLGGEIEICCGDGGGCCAH